MTRNRSPFRGRRALVTGASGGIGRSIALQLAAAGSDLVLVARSEDALRSVADEAGRHGVDARVLVADLSTTEGVADVVAQLADTRIDILVANAGVGSHGPFVDESSNRTATQIALNCAAVTELTHAFLPGMLARRVGGVLTVASTASFQPTPGMAVYGATKAFVLSFTESLWQETLGRGVRVLALCPGPTSTGFFEAAGGGEALLEAGRQTPDEVASVGLAAFARGGGPTVVSGLGNRLTASAHRFVPRALMVRLAALATAR
ncbi:oxidoreductase [Curtobacterium sp. 'Ferrero']|uniref:SDR family NAD(P)-dependent oxidoreductase n=1 Tax=Curtobacterium sp. 'Ferrero' TaxID=2033654 RepID=UPI000BC60359|nr:SDR family oxidoreductase [Curtobacterium sp. 'Ferrero']PCN48192.1 oxidoreductase [Curtobacterium sp. 'Ferrero']